MPGGRRGALDRAESQTDIHPARPHRWRHVRGGLSNQNQASSGAARPQPGQAVSEGTAGNGCLACKSASRLQEQLRALIAATAPEYRLLVRFLAATGLRIGEAVALRWTDVDFGRRLVRVRRRYYKGTFEPPKSRFGRRDVPLAPGLARDLWELRKGVAGDDALVFPGKDGAPLAQSSPYRAIRAAGEIAGVPWAGNHTLRHTCATMLFKNGLNAKQVQVWLGHHDPAFTSRPTCISSPTISRTRRSSTSWSPWRPTTTRSRRSNG